ncbi:MAG: hypothetical protein IIB80_09890 [Thaumarchaeota archaeon]|nr:hypothetical protein [Nitrososphaerota archaeon]
MVNSSWKDLDVHGRRLNKILKILDKKFDKVPKDDIDGLSRIAATIGNLTRQTVEVIKLVDNYEEIDAWFSTLKKDELVIKKQRLRQLDKQNKEEKQEIQNQIEREKYEIHEEKVARRQREKEMRL